VGVGFPVGPPTETVTVIGSVAVTVDDDGVKVTTGVVVVALRSIFVTNAMELQQDLAVFAV